MLVVEAGDVVELLAARGQEGATRLDRDLFQRLQAIGAETRAHHVDPLDPLACQRDERGLGVGLQPFGLAEAALEGHDHLQLRRPQVFGQQARRFLAFAVVGVAEQQGALGHAVKAQHQAVGAAMGLPMVEQALGQRADVAGVVVEVVHAAQFRQGAYPARPVADRIGHARRRRGAVLRVQRQHQDVIDAGALELVEHARDRRVAIPHRRPHQHVLAAFAQVTGQ
jgi:hypothetical protein